MHIPTLVLSKLWIVILRSLDTWGRFYLEKESSNSQDEQFAAFLGQNLA